jgi:hypothetical protein
VSRGQYIEEIGQDTIWYENRQAIRKAMVDRYGVQMNPSFFGNDSRFFDEKPWREVRDKLAYSFGFQA